MLTSEQTTIRRLENEARELRKENERLTAKIDDIRDGLRKMIIELAGMSYMPWKHKIQLRELEKELE